MTRRRGTILVSKRRQIADNDTKVPTSAIKGAGVAAPTDSSPQILDDMIKTLKTNKHILVDELTGRAKTTFDTLVAMTKSLRGHSNYATIYDTIQENFKDEGRGRPGTVLAYLTGCMFSRDGEQVGCSYSCQNSLQPPSSYNFKCREKVIACSVENDRYHFTVHQDTSSNRAIVYVPGITVPEDFVGFSESEINQLRDLGVRFVLIRGIPPGSIDFVEISDGYIMISNMNTRGNVTIVQDNNDYSGLMIAILVILSGILLLMVFGILWHLFGSKVNKVNPTFKDTIPNTMFKDGMSGAIGSAAMSSVVG